MHYVVLFGLFFNFNKLHNIVVIFFSSKYEFYTIFKLEKFRKGYARFEKNWEGVRASEDIISSLVMTTTAPQSVVPTLADP